MRKHISPNATNFCDRNVFYTNANSFQSIATDTDLGHCALVLVWSRRLGYI